VRRERALPAPTFAAMVLAIMVVLYGVDRFLAAQEQSELEQEAANHNLNGLRLLHEGKPAIAVVEFSRAHSIERSNREYDLALAEALLADHRLSAARDTLTEALEEDSNDGRANLLMARVEAADGHLKDADSYYHRAIYGEWPQASAGEPSKIRLELANLLANHGQNQELLSELLLLENRPNQDAATEQQVARLFLREGSAQRAAEAYRRLIQENPDDVDAHLGLAQAETLAGNYRGAESAVVSALHRQPYDPRIQAQLRLVVALARLDPTSRRLSSAEKYRRSLEILARIQAELSACEPNSPNSQSATATEKIRGPITNEIAEARLDQAESLWEQFIKSCRRPLSADDPLPLLMKKLSQ
jgi:Tfp pilus assembly protein PilF